MTDLDLGSNNETKAPVQTKLVEILKLHKKDELYSMAEYFSISGRGKLNKESLAAKLYPYLTSLNHLEESLLGATNKELSLIKQLLLVPYSEINTTIGILRYLLITGVIFFIRTE